MRGMTPTDVPAPMLERVERDDGADGRCASGAVDRCRPGCLGIDRPEHTTRGVRASIRGILVPGAAVTQLGSAGCDRSIADHAVHWFLFPGGGSATAGLPDGTLCLAA